MQFKRIGQLAAAAILLGTTLVHAEVVEEIIAQVNDQPIVLSEYRKSLEALRAEVSQSGVSALQAEARYQEQSRNVLRDLIDHQLLVQKAGELGLNADTEVVKRLDEIRQQMKLPSMEALEQAVAQQGMVYEDFKQEIRDNILTQWVIQREVGGRVVVTPDEIKAYYDAHQKDFERPEGVTLQEILISTEGKSDEEIAAQRKKAEEVLAKLRGGADFAETARQNSDDASAARGGDIGFVERGSMPAEMEQIVYRLDKNQISDIIPTRYGFMILKVVSKTQAGVPPLEAVENQIHEKIYLDKIQPALREYLNRLRQESYISIKPGYVDSGEAPKQAAR